MTFLNSNFTKEQFLDNVKNHSMRIFHDDIYRHLEFSNRGGYLYRFQLTTWPGYLHISGDMGDYTFARENDMFTFFRGPEPSYAYWAQKIRAEDPSSRVKQFTFDAFKVAILDICDEQRREIEDTTKYAPPDYLLKRTLKRYDAWQEEIKKQLSRNTHINEFEANNLIEEWIEEDHSFTKPFENFWLNYGPVEEFDYHFMWCCNAILFGISAYDKHKSKNKS